jgi:hypothetical protein
MRTISILLIALLSLSVVGCGPIVTLPGGSLSGTVKPVPSDWSFSDEVDTVQLETRPGDPYSVNVWTVAVGERLYIASAKRDQTWAQNILADPLVRLRIGEDLYELSATLTEDAAERDAFLLAAKRKYDYEADAAASEAVLFRLEPR